MISLPLATAIERPGIGPSLIAARARESILAASLGCFTGGPGWTEAAAHSPNASHGVIEEFYITSVVGQFGLLRMSTPCSSLNGPVTTQTDPLPITSFPLTVSTALLSLPHHEFDSRFPPCASP